MKPPSIRLAFDCVILSVMERKLHVALGRRAALNEVGETDPFPNAYSLPGGYVRDHEAVADTIRRRLWARDRASTSIPCPSACSTTPSATRGTGWSPSRCYALIPTEQAEHLQWGPAYKSGGWYPIDELPARGWAFDHRQIVQRALSELRYHALREPTGFALLPKNFALRELHALQEQLRQEAVDLRNFRKYIVRTGLVEEVGSTWDGTVIQPRSTRCGPASSGSSRRRLRRQGVSNGRLDNKRPNDTYN
ncbi:MAG: NUDIX hydrolase [Opitutaceae bacterium]|nr:NUDIX hydrolase [Opitutaceae bacterium]